MKIIIIGIQGAGKSTQGNLLSEKYQIPYLSSGHIFRQMAKEKTPWGRYIKETINAGVLMPDQKTIEVIEEYLHKPAYSKGYILDGFPRTVTQAQLFKDDISHAIYLKVSDKEALWRLSGRLDSSIREDNTIQAIRKRIESFRHLTKPVVNYYRKQKLLAEIDGEQEIDSIFSDICDVLD